MPRACPLSSLEHNDASRQKRSPRRSLRETTQSTPRANPSAPHARHVTDSNRLNISTCMPCTASTRECPEPVSVGGGTPCRRSTRAYANRRPVRAIARRLGASIRNNRGRHMSTLPDWHRACAADSSHVLADREKKKSTGPSPSKTCVYTQHAKKRHMHVSSRMYRMHVVARTRARSQMCGLKISIQHCAHPNSCTHSLRML